MRAQQVFPRELSTPTPGHQNKNTGAGGWVQGLDSAKGTSEIATSRDRAIGSNCFISKMHTIASLSSLWIAHPWAGAGNVGRQETDGTRHALILSFQAD